MRSYVICKTDEDITIGDPVILVNKFQDYPIMEDEFVVRRVK